MRLQLNNAQLNLIFQTFHMRGLSITERVAFWLKFYTKRLPREKDKMHGV